jgi:transketolase
LTAIRAWVSLSRKPNSFHEVLMTTASPSTRWQDAARHAAQGIRRRVLEHTVEANGGYLSQACSSAEILAVLYTHLMRLGPSEGPLIPVPFSGAPGANNPRHVNGGVYNGPKAPHLDRFILSPTHYALALYAALIEAGRLAPEGLAQFNQDGSSVEMIGGEHSPGLEVTGGSFGQAWLSLASAVAIPAASGCSCPTVSFRKGRCGKRSWRCPSIASTT